MDRQCKKCGVTSVSVTAAIDAKCPACGAIYTKVDAAINAQAKGETLSLRSPKSPRQWNEVWADRLLIAFGVGFTVFVVSYVFRDTSTSSVPSVDVVSRRPAGEIPIAATPALEQSAFFVKYPPVRKSQWALQSGGTNFSYSFPDPDNPGQSFSIELSPNASNITQAGVSWNGASTSAPARLTPLREEFLRDWLRAVFPEINVERVVEIAREQQEMNYDGGSRDMPRKRVPGFDVIAGTVASGRCPTGSCNRRRCVTRYAANFGSST